MLAVALPLAFIVGTDAWKRLALVGVILLLIAVELINTAIEKLSDHVTTARSPEIGPFASATVAASNTSPTESAVSVFMMSSQGGRQRPRAVSSPRLRRAVLHLPGAIRV